MSMVAEQEALSLWLALLSYMAAGVVAVWTVILGKRLERLIGGLVVMGLVLHGLSLGLRWQRLDHGPFGTLFEILSSNVFSFLVAFILGYWRLPVLRPMAAVLLPIVFVMMGWLLLASPRDNALPSTYNTIWLYVHVGFGKIFMGAVLLAVGLASVILARSTARGRQWFASLPGDGSLDELSYRFLAIGLVFDTLMLIAGALWAQAAWGRYWYWDPLETWSLIAWLLLAITLHVRPLAFPAPRLTAWLTWAIFIVAFVTFFGVPFVSQVTHQGVV